MLCQLAGQQLVKLSIEHSISHELRTDVYLQELWGYARLAKEQPWPPGQSIRTFLFLLICVAMLTALYML